MDRAVTPHTAPSFFGQLQRIGRPLHQFSDSCAAANIALVHHPANTRAIQGITRLQQFHPSRIQGRLLLTNGLQYGEVFFVILQRVEEQPAGCQL